MPTYNIKPNTTPVVPGETPPNFLVVVDEAGNVLSAGSQAECDVFVKAKVAGVPWAPVIEQVDFTAKYTKVQLQDLAKSASLKTGGTEAQLVERLLAAGVSL